MLDHTFKIIGISETKLSKHTKPKFNIKLKGYKCYHVDTEADKGGTLIYVSKTLNTNERPDLEQLLYKSEVLESTFIEIINPNKKNTIVGCIYRHPSMDLEEFNNEYLIPFMEILDKENKNKYLMGDFNVDLLKIEDDINSSIFFDILTSNFFVPHIIHPTRITVTTKTLIDNIFSNSKNYEEGESGNLTVSLSDHLAQFLIIPNEIHHVTPKTRNQYIWDIKKFDSENFNRELFKIEWPSILNLHINDPNLAYEGFQEKIDSIIKKYLPKRKMTNKEAKQCQKPWITNDILKLIHQRNNLHKKFVKAKNKDAKLLLHTRYKTIRNQIVSLCRQNKREYYHNYFMVNSNNLKNTWKGVKSIINLGKNDKSNPTSLLINDELNNNPSKIANEFNNYFTKIAEKIQSTIHTQGQDFNKYLQNKVEHNFFIKPTNQYEIIDTINTNINNKSSGPNSIPNIIFQSIKLFIAEPLADIINLSFSTGEYINKLKLSKVIPIYKEKGDRLSSINYRPISLLSNINKIFEKLMHKRLYSFLEKQKCIYDYQFGFRKYHSTTHALIDLTEDVRKAIDNNTFSCGVFIDLQKAFDTVDHNILLKKLEHYGIRGIANDWFNSYLKNRNQYVSISGYESNILNINFGVPQGSVLGPLLFLIYINDLNKAIKYSKTRHFADDTNLLIRNKSLKQLQKHMNYDLRQLCHWLKANKISLNSSKTELIIFRHPNKQINYKLKIKINGKKLIPSNFVKYLCIYIDNHLNWSYQVNSLSSRLSRAAGMLSKIRHYVTKATLRSIYFGIFSSLLTYGSQVWGQFSNINIRRLQQIQNKAIRIINFAPYREPVTPLYYKSNILKLTDHVKIQNIIYVLNSLKGDLPVALKDSFKTTAEAYTYNTRSASQYKIILPKARTQNYGINSIKYRSAACWNEIVTSFPNEKFHLQSKSVCIKHISKYFTGTYNI